ncbi:argininosuccinate synthase [soil metagenome]
MITLPSAIPFCLKIDDPPPPALNFRPVRNSIARDPFKENFPPMATVVLAYSGGLDTSVILKYLIEEEGHVVHAVYVDVGQPCDDIEAIKKKAIKCGAVGSHVVDKKEELCRDYAFPTLQWDAKYESVYLMGTSIARPVIAKACIEVAHKVGATHFAHGATGKGNDQCRFQLTAEALDPSIKIIAPWRTEKYRKSFPGREAMIAYSNAHKIPIKATKAKPYSSDENCLHISYEAGVLENPGIEGISVPEYSMVVLPEKAPNKSEQVKVRFEDGIPVAVNGKKLRPFALVDALNKIGGRHGVGLLDMVENRFVGMKSRGVYEAPGMTILYSAHRNLEQLTMDRELMHLRDRLIPEMAELVYYGFWYCRKMDSLLAFIKEAQQRVTGEVTLKLYKGNVTPVSRKSPYSLYDESVATMEGGGNFNQDDSTGFLRIQGLPIRVQARTAGWSKNLTTAKKTVKKVAKVKKTR